MIKAAFLSEKGKQALKQTYDLLSDLRKRHQIEFDPQQREALSSRSGTVLLLAVPGAGKTTVAVSRIAALILEDGVLPEQILPLTFSRESARDMKARFSALFGGLVPKPPAFSTIHSFCFGVLRTYAERSGRPLPALIDEQPLRQTDLLRALYREQTGEFADDDTLEELVRLIGYCQNTLSPPETLAASASQPAFPALYNGYRALKRARRLMDFDDMMEMALKAFRADPALLAHYRKRFRHISLDEAQDTSLLQHRVLEALSAGCESLFYVGDEDQSIYSFRGADPGYLLTLGRRPEVRVLKMERSFRLGKPVAEAAQRIISLNRGRFEKAILPAREDGPAVVVSPLPDAPAQYARLLEELSRLPDGRTAAVLYRNNPSAIGVAALLDRAGIGFFMREHTAAFAKNLVVRDVLSVMGLSFRPWDLDAFGRVYYKLGAYISRAMFEEAQKKCRPKEPVLDFLLRRSQETNKSAPLALLKSQLERLSSLRPAEAVDFVLGPMNYRRFLESRSGGGEALALNEQKLEALRLLARDCADFPALAERIDGLDRLIARHASPDSDRRITLSTIHSSKGLEFDYVYLIDLTEGILPSAGAIQDQKRGLSEAMEDENRLCYVAVTRARERLELLSPSRLPSRYLDRAAGAAEDRLREGLRDELSGRRILHRFFGYGRVLSVSPEQNSCRVDFGKLGVKTLTLDIFLEEGPLITFADRL